MPLAGVCVSLRMDTPCGGEGYRVVEPESAVVISTLRGISIYEKGFLIAPVFFLHLSDESAHCAGASHPGIRRGGLDFTWLCRVLGNYRHQQREIV